MVISLEVGISVNKHHLSSKLYVIMALLLLLPLMAYCMGGVISSIVELILAEGFCLAVGYIMVQHRIADTMQQDYEDRLARQTERIHQLNRMNYSRAEDLDTIANAGYGIWKILINSDGRNAMMVNDKIQDILGIRDMMLSPEKLYDYYHERLDDRDEIQKDDYQEMQEGRVATRIISWNHPTKGKIKMRVGGNLHVGKDGVCYMSGYCADVTAQVEKEASINEQLRMALENEQKANAAKTAFMASMSHDIRTPLNCIIGLLELSSNHPDDRKLLDENREKAKVAAKHLLELISDVLEITKLDVDKVVLAHDAFNMRSFGDDIETVVKERAVEYGVEFISENTITDICNHAYFFGSPVHLRQIFLNVYSNSMKYNRKGGKVYIRKELVEETDKTVTIRFIISDTGIGMSEAFLAHVFEPFTQEQVTARSTYQGTGLGMYIVKRLVELMKGTIQVTSVEGEGSTFYITLPFEIATEADMPDKMDMNSLDIKGMKVLVVEDNAINAEIVEQILVDFGAVVNVVENGREAVEEFMAKPPGTYDVILMDLMMPVMDGYAATRTIRAYPREDAKRTPIYALTANAFADDIRKCAQAGMDGHLAKPVDVQKLKTTLAKIYNS